MKVIVEKNGPVTTVIVNRPEVRNAIDRETAELLAEAFRAFEADVDAKVAIFMGADGNFGSGADLKAMADGGMARMEEDGDSPLGVTRMRLSKPVIAAVSGYAVAGGMAIALWCDMRVVEENAIFGMFDRRYGVPMVGAVTVRLPRLIGLSHAMDIILTGRPVHAQEALTIGLANRVVPEGKSREEAEALAHQLASFPWECLVNDRRATLEGWDMDDEMAQKNEFRLGMEAITSGQAQTGASQFSSGVGRHGSVDEFEEGDAQEAADHGDEGSPGREA